MTSPTTPPPALEGVEEEARKTASNIVTGLCVKRGQMIGFKENEWLEEAITAALLSALAGRRETVTKAVAALTEAEAILGGEYGDHYGVLCQQMIELRAALQTQERTNG